MLIIVFSDDSTLFLLKRNSTNTATKWHAEYNTFFTYAVVLLKTCQHNLVCETDEVSF